MDFLMKIVQWFDRKLIIPVMMWIVQFFSKKVQMRLSGDGELTDWKQEALKDFRFWLEDLPELRPAEGAAKESCDLYTLLSEFTTLKQEIKLQNREQEKSLQSLDNFLNTYREAATLFKQKTKQLEKLEENIRLSVEKKAVLPFLDIRDTLIRGYKASKEVAQQPGGFFKQVPKGIEGIIEGYEMAIRRFDLALEMVGVRPVETIDKPFNPKTMKAADKRAVPDKDKGVVIEELLSGFVRESEVIRFAEVVVNA